MVYTEIQKRRNKEYHYLVHTVRVDSKYKKIRLFLGVDLSQSKLKEIIKRKESLMNAKIKLYKDSIKDKFEMNFDFSKKILSDSTDVQGY